MHTTGVVLPGSAPRPRLDASIVCYVVVVVVECYCFLIDIIVSDLKLVLGSCPRKTSLFLLEN